MVRCKMIERSAREDCELDIGSRNGLRRGADRSVASGNQDSFRPSSDRPFDLRLKFQWLDFLEIKTARRRQRVSGLLEASCSAVDERRNKRGVRHLVFTFSLVCRPE